MAYTASQLVSLACQISKQSGFIFQCGQFLNQILSSYCHTYDLDYITKTATLNIAPQSNLKPPFPLPADYLRERQVYYNIDGEIIECLQMSLEKFNQQFVGPGVEGYPERFATDISQNPPVMYFWQPAAVPLSVTVLYRPLMPDIASPESSNVIPWFHDQRILLKDLCIEMMMLGDDTGRKQDLEREVTERMRKYLTMKDDSEGFAKRVKLDPDLFRNNRFLKPTKNMPFVWVIFCLIPFLFDAINNPIII